LIQYLASLTTAKLILWGYFLWYLVFAYLYFDPDPRLWLTSLGLALIVGFALYTNARASSDGNRPLEAWQTFRFFLTPFCVSSFSALVKGRNFILIFSPNVEDNLIAAGIILAASVLVVMAKK
jgi:hypothetical protein